ncbi:HEAT repeat domain-containing protein [Cystobacter fuscus]|uniref:HEAT repeat domain-containing protein n=1 Tax=Cystobacter fuscus TaxID=43 RepID=UPI002B287EFB|nr:hypothetical protein F0U63_32475 [Cystobacter fuscus]
MRDFADISRLETEALRSLLETGAAPERVRAAWALALRLGGMIRPELIQDSMTEPHPGVRRHLVVVLAGYQERAVLATLARQDLDAEVRAVACQYLAMLGRSEDTDSWRVLHERLEADTSAEVRRACIASLPSHTPDFVRNAVAGVVGDESLDVRREAACKWLEWAGGLPDVLVARVTLEPDPELRRELVRRGCAVDGGRSLLKALLDAPEETLRLVLETCAEREYRLPWSLLQPISRRGRPGLDSLLMDVLEADAPAEVIVWLLMVALRFWRDPSQDYDDEVARAAYEALGCLASRLEAGHLGEPDARARALAHELRELLAEERRRLLPAHREWCDAPEHEECLVEEWGLDGMMELLGRIRGTSGS